MTNCNIPNWRSGYKGKKFKVAWPTKRQTIATKTCRRRPFKWDLRKRMKLKFKQ